MSEALQQAIDERTKKRLALETALGPSGTDEEKQDALLAYIAACDEVTRLEKRQK